LAGIALVLALGHSPGLAAIIPVGGACMLVDAITAANTDAATGGCPAGSGADTIVLPAGSTQTLTEVNNRTYGPTGLPVISSVITIAEQGSMIVRTPEVPEFRIVAVGSGDLTLQETTVSGGVSAPRVEGGYYIGGGVANYSGTLTVTDCAISGNAASRGGGVSNEGTSTLVRTLVSGNTASYGPELFNTGTVLADNHNLFGVDGTAGVEGITPGAMDIVPPIGVQLADILDPTLANNGGPTQTYALVPGSPAIDASGTDCTDANGDPLPTDQRGRPRMVDGDGGGTAACDIGAFEFFPIVNDFVMLDSDPETAFDPTPRRCVSPSLSSRNSRATTGCSMQRRGPKALAPP
jgi:hypothetical protein